MSLNVAIIDILLDWVWVILLGDASQSMGSSGSYLYFSSFNK